MATFNTVGGEGYNLSNIRPVYDPSDSETVGDGSIQLQRLNLNKTTAQTYYWLTEEGCGVEDEDGWYDNDAGEGSNAEYEFDPAEGFRITSANDIMPFTFAGEVKYPVALTLQKGTSICGNFLPVVMKLSQIAPVYDPSESETVGDGSIQLQRLNLDKTTAKTYYWLTEEGCGVEDEDGWYDNDAGEGSNAEYEFASGDGFFVTLSNSAIDFSFPELKTK